MCLIVVLVEHSTQWGTIPNWGTILSAPLIQITNDELCTNYHLAHSEWELQPFPLLPYQELNLNLLSFKVVSNLWHDCAILLSGSIEPINYVTSVKSLNPVQVQSVTLTRLRAVHRSGSAGEYGPSFKESAAAWSPNYANLVAGGRPQKGMHS